MIHPGTPSDRPGGDLDDVLAGRLGEEFDPEADPQVNDGAPNPDAVVRFEEPTLEAPQDGVPQGRRRSVLAKGLSVMGLSTIARRFDRQGRGHLDEAEQRARDLADSQGHVRPDQAIAAMELGMANEKKLNKAVRRGKMAAVCILALFAGLVVAVFYASGKAVSKGNIEVKEKIDESIQTDIAVDSLGAPHLTDKASGKDITVKADGVVAGTTPRVLNGRKLTCISMVDVAKAVNGLATASTSVNLVFHDEEGIETEITPLTDFKDKQSHLSFDGGRIRVRMDSEACDAAAALDEGEIEGGDRRLGQANSLTSPVVPNNGSVQAKLRQAYVTARMAVREGRRLDINGEAEVTTDGTFLTKEAVDAYVNQGCASNSDCDILGTYGPIGAWDVSLITDMSYLFTYKATFDEAIGGWNTSSVTNMAGMFAFTNYFNQPLNFDTSRVTDMHAMFNDARAFNQDLSSFNTSSVTSMYGMFYGASAFNQDLSSWDTSSVTAMAGMFYGASLFNQSLCAWGYHYDAADPSTKYEQMFLDSNCTNKGDPQGRYTNWCEESCPGHEFWTRAELQAAVDSYTNQDCAIANPDCDIENTYGPIGVWDTSRVTNMSDLFRYNPIFNGAIGGWDTSSVTTMEYMFLGATFFNQPLTWDTSRVTTMYGMFVGASAFNQPLDWDTSRVTTMQEMFYDAGNFSQDLCAWGVHYNAIEVYYNDMFNGTNCLGANKPNGQYTNWCEESCPTPAFADKAELKAAVEDFIDQDCSVGNCDIENTYGPIGMWNVSRVTDMSGLFDGKTSFNNGAIGVWDTSHVTNMQNMFKLATSFNQPLNFDTSSVTNIRLAQGKGTGTNLCNQ